MADSHWTKTNLDVTRNYFSSLYTQTHIKYQWPSPITSWYGQQSQRRTLLSLLFKRQFSAFILQPEGVIIAWLSCQRPIPKKKPFDSSWNAAADFTVGSCNPSHFYPLKKHHLSLDLSPGVHARCSGLLGDWHSFHVAGPRQGEKPWSALMNLTHQWTLHNDKSGYCTWNELIVQRKCEATRSGTELLRILSLHIIITQFVYGHQSSNHVPLKDVRYSSSDVLVSFVVMLQWGVAHLGTGNSERPNHRCLHFSLFHPFPGYVCTFGAFEP